MTHPTDALRLVPVSLISDTMTAMARAYERIHSMPRISDTELAIRVGEAKERLRPYLAAPASPLPEGGGWRTDFENAPKDGSVFMVGYDDGAAKKAGLFENKDRVYEARWNDIQSTWSARNGFILHSDATHWLPLPAAPTGAK